VELLADCCEHVSKADLDPLVDACFSLADAAQWKPEGRRWAEQEFGLLRLAACIAGRPGHFLLIQSLERSFWGMAGRLVPHLDSKAMYQWAMCAFHALNARDAQAIRRELPALLRACDERLLSSLMPGHEVGDTPKVPSRAGEPCSGEKPGPQVTAREESPDPVPVPKGAEDSELDARAREGRPDSPAELLSEEKSQPEACTREQSLDPVPTPMGVERAASEPCVSNELSSSAVAPPFEERPTLEPTPREELPAPTTAPPGVETSELTSAAKRGLAGSVCANRSACRTGSCKARPTGGLELCEVGVDGLSCRPQAP
jgi:hypothetical protein